MPIFATIREGEHKGELVPVLNINPTLNLMPTPAPRNRYASGYGRKIPTGFKVRVFDPHWRRVYVAQYSNAGTPYIIHKGEAFRVDW